MFEKLNQIINHFGDVKQTIKAVEEMSELQKELCKSLIGKGDKEHIIEEIADVNIMLEQLRIIFNIPYDDVLNVVNAKIERTLNYIANEKKD